VKDGLGSAKRVGRMALHTTFVDFCKKDFLTYHPPKS
jgi:hypothetical protein